MEWIPLEFRKRWGIKQWNTTKWRFSDFQFSTIVTKLWPIWNSLSCNHSNQKSSDDWEETRAKQDSSISIRRRSACHCVRIGKLQMSKSAWIPIKDLSRKKDFALHTLEAKRKFLNRHFIMEACISEIDRPVCASCDVIPSDISFSPLFAWLHGRPQQCTHANNAQGQIGKMEGKISVNGIHQGWGSSRETPVTFRQFVPDRSTICAEIRFFTSQAQIK